MFIPQMRRRAPGWDGCRDRLDGRDDLEHKLQWLHPPQRAGHRGLFLPGEGLMFIYGGRGFTGPVKPDTSVTPKAIVRGDLWQFSISACRQCAGGPLPACRPTNTYTPSRRQLSQELLGPGCLPLRALHLRPRLLRRRLQQQCVTEGDMGASARASHN